MIIIYYLSGGEKNVLYASSIQTERVTIEI